MSGHDDAARDVSGEGGRTPAARGHPQGSLASALVEIGVAPGAFDPDDDVAPTGDRDRSWSPLAGMDPEAFVGQPWKLAVELTSSRLVGSASVDAGSDVIDGDLAARVRVAVARHLHDGTAPYSPVDVPPDLEALLPTSGPGARAAVVIRSHNHGGYLLDALASIRLCQEQLEIVIVDEASDDPLTLAVLAAVESGGTRCIRQESVGRARAQNLGTTVTRAPYLLWLEADHLLRPGFVEAAVAMLDEDPRLAVVHANLGTFGAQHGRWEAPRYDLSLLLTGNYLGTFAVIRRDALEDVGGWDERLTSHEDWDLWLGLSAHTWGFSRWDGIGGDMRIRTRTDRVSPAHRDADEGVLAAVTMATKHSDLYAANVVDVVSNFATALSAADPVASGGLRHQRVLADELAHARAEGDRHAVAAAAARDVVAETREALDIAIRQVENVESELAHVRAESGRIAATHAGIRALLAEANDALDQEAAHAARADAEIAALYRTRTLRRLAGPRRLWSRYLRWKSRFRLFRRGASER